MIFPSPLIGRDSQWEAENPNFLVIWPTDKCEGSKWGRILPGIHWAYQIFSSPLIGQNSQWEAENPSFLVIWPTDKCEGSSMSFVSKNVFYIYTMGFVYINII